MFRELWAKDFQVVAMGSSWQDELNPAWVHDCMLDMVASTRANLLAVDIFTLKRGFEHQLTPPQQTVKELLLPLVQLYGDKDVRHSSAWRHLATLCHKFGQAFDVDDEGCLRPVD